MEANSEQPSERSWRDLYLAALFEADSSKLPERIAEAECALSVRDRALWYSGGDHDKEKHALIECHARARSVAEYTSVLSPDAFVPQPWC